MIVARAEEQAGRLVEEHAVTVAAREHAERVATDAQARLEVQLSAFVRSVRVGLSQLEPAQAEGTDAPTAIGDATPPPPAPIEEAAQPLEAHEPAVPLATVVGLEPATPAPPTPIHGLEREGATDELTNLLTRSPRNGGAVRVEEGVAVIDDFSHPPLDDAGDRRD